MNNIKKKHCVFKNRLKYFEAGKRLSARTLIDKDV